MANNMLLQETKK